MPIEEVADNLQQILDKLIEESMKSYARKAGGLVMKKIRLEGQDYAPLSRSEKLACHPCSKLQRQGLSGGLDARHEDR